MMRVLILSIIKPFEGSGDGTTEYTYQLCERLRAKGKVEVSVEYFLDKAKRNNTKGLIYTYSQLSAMAKRAAKGNYDVVHITSHEIGTIAKILKHMKVKAKIVTTVHDTTRLEKGMHHGILQKSFNVIVRGNLRDALEYSDGIIFVSERTEREIEKRYRNTVKKNTVIMHGLREELFTAPLPRRQKRELLTVGYIGSLAYHKNVIVLMKAARMMKDTSRKAKVVIYGAGVEEKNLLKFKKENALDNVSFRGFAPEAEIVKIYDSFDAFVFPSLYEGFGFHILEAQIRGIPVLVMKRGVLPDEVKKYAIEINDENDLVERLDDIRRGEYKKWALAAMEYAKRFTWSKSAADTERFYMRVTKRAK